MTLNILDRKIDRVRLIDDDQGSREAYSYPIEELELEYHLEEGPIENLDDYVQRLRTTDDAVICDHHLKKKGQYSNFNGAEVICRLYKENFPGILCTSYQDRVEELRRYRRCIPILLNPSELNTDTIAQGLEVCIKEMKGDIQEQRKPWRTLVRIQDLDTQINEQNPYVEFVVPAWDPYKVIRILLDDIPTGLQQDMKPGLRCFAQVNLGAESDHDLYIDEWEPMDRKERKCQKTK